MSNEMQDSMGMDMSKTVDYTCEKCNFDVFEAKCKIRKLPAEHSQSGDDVVIPIQVFVCGKCGHINEEFQQGEFE